MSIKVVIIHYGSLERTKDCLTKLAKKIGTHKLILINNTKDSLEALTKIIPGTKVINNNQNTGFAKAANQGIALGLADPSTSHIFLMNNDLYLATGTLDELLTTFRIFVNVGLVAPILHHQGGFDWGGKYNPWTGLVKHVNWPNKPKTVLSVGHVAGAALLISREVIEKIGMFDERFFLYYEDLDFCLRIRAGGYSIRLNPAVVAEHATSASSNLFVRTLEQWRSHFLFVAKHFPRNARPTAFVTDLLLYPLFLIKALFSR